MNKSIKAIKVSQWLAEWDKYDFNPDQRRRKPLDHFFVFSIKASTLKSLSGIYRRTSDEKEKGFNENIQRRHEEDRSKTIKEFIKNGYPYSDLSLKKKELGEYDNLKKPGWLPTAIVINILTTQDIRRGNSKVQENDLIKVDEINSEIILPQSYDINEWQPKDLYPIEVIDGQHRLWAFENKDEDTKDFELPVVAFYGLDISWQAYLFWSINITPKKINPSLAYDLYPLLRNEDWLEKDDNYIVYREARAQELVEGLWSHPQSIWLHKINMLGEPGNITISQSAFIQAIINSLFKPQRQKSGGIFNSPLGGNQEVLGWSGSQQVAFIIHCWNILSQKVYESKNIWALKLREGTIPSMMSRTNDPAFFGKFSLLRTDQGVRGFLSVLNDIIYLIPDKINLFELLTNSSPATATDEIAVNEALSILKQNNSASEIINILCEGLTDFDWRTSAAPGLTFEEQSLKAGFRGTGGYKMVRLNLLKLLESKNDLVGKTASVIIKSQQ